MSLFDNNGMCSKDWDIFLDNFPNIGAFKLPHDSEYAYIDRNAANILQITPENISKEDLFTLIDKLNNNAVECYKNIYVYSFNGETRYVNMKIVTEQNYLLGFIQDVTSIMHSQPLREQENECDSLTGILTREYFIKHVRKALSDIAGAAQCCMAVVHVNGIERVDNELNYEKTSLCVSAVASAIKRFRSEDVIVGCKSYKDYFIFFKQAAKEEVKALLRKISDAVRNTRITDEFGNEIQTRSGFFSLTSGYCWYPSQAATIDMMINYADFAMFRAISSGSSEKEFSPDEYVSEQNSYADSSQLATLIDENRFGYHFQPIVSAVDGNVYAYEALMRPENLTPLEVLRMARDHGRLYDIELLTFENVLSKARQMQHELQDKKIFINSIPDYMLKEADFYRLLEKYPDIVPELVIELTEQADLTDERVKGLRQIYCDNGCMIAIDDYGSGYSNSAAVLSLAPDIIKIDRTLISDIDKNTRKQHFLSGIVDFAHMNGIRVLAEGVETYEEMSTVIRRGVDYIQGFYTARPAPTLASSISFDIVSSIKSINLSKPDLKAAKIYDIKEANYDPLDLNLIAEDHYTSINISSDYAHLKGNAMDSATLNIMIAENKSTLLVLEDVCLNGGVRPCITLGENSHVRLELRGRNSMLYDGIILPDSAELTLVGDGDLYIDSYRNNGCCIGASYNDSFGRIVVNIEGTLEMSANGDHAVCIGGGVTSRKNALSIMSGNVKASVTGVDSIGIGTYNGKCSIFVGNGSEVTVTASGDNCVGIGSLYGAAETTISNCSVFLNSLGINACGIGTLALTSRSNQIINLSRINADITVKSQRGACIGFITTESNILINDSRLNLYFEGDLLAGIGSVEGRGTIEIDGSVIDVESQAGVKSRHIGTNSGSPGIHNSTVNNVSY